MGKKGGNRRESVEPVNVEDLAKIWKKAIDAYGMEAFNLGVYNDLKVSQACSARGLAANAFFVREFLAISSGEILFSQMKQSLKKHAATHNVSSFKDDLWAGQIAHCLVCLMSHYRRLRREPGRLRQCFATATGVERQIIQGLLDIEPAQACKKANPKEGDCEAEQQDTVRKRPEIAREADAERNETTACEKADSSRRLKRQVSEVTLDSEGFPLMLRSPDDSASEKATQGVPKRSFKEQTSPVSLDSEGFPRMLQTPPSEKPAAEKENKQNILFKRKDGKQREQLSIAAEEAAAAFAEKSPPAKKRPAAKRGCKRKAAPEDGPERRPQTVKKRPAANVAPENPQLGPERRPQTVKKRPAANVAPENPQLGPERRPWQKTRKVLAKKQSYLQGWIDQSWKLIVACSEGMASAFPGGHQAVIKKLEESVMEEDATKSKMVAKRNALLKA